MVRNIQKAFRLSDEEKDKKSKLLQQTMVSIIDLLEDQLDKKPILPIKTISFIDLELINKPDFGAKSTEEEVQISTLLFQLPKTEMEALVLFLLIKESFKHFQIIPQKFSDITEIMLNFTAILWLKDNLAIRSLDNRIITAIRSKIYGKDPEGFSYAWVDILIVLFSEDINFKVFLLEYFQLLQKNIQNKIAKEQFLKNISTWIKRKTIRPEEVIAPIQLSHRLLAIVQHLINLGYEESSTSTISEIMNVHQNTIRNAFTELLSDFFTFWRPRINLELIKLNPYFFRILFESKKQQEKMQKELLKIPYMKNILTGVDTQGHYSLSSYNFHCPHVIGENLQYKLKKMQSNDLLFDFTLQPIRQIFHYGCATTSKFEPTLNNFRKLLFDWDAHTDYKKLTYLEETINFSLEFKDEAVPIDYNLLYFLSILKNKYLVKARYGIYIDEFYHFCKELGIPRANFREQMNLLNQLEIRARRRNLLKYKLVMRSYTRFNDRLIIDIYHQNKAEKVLDEVLDKFRVFSWQSCIQAYDRTVIILSGINHNHPISEIIAELFKSYNLAFEFYTDLNYESQFVPLHKLFDFENNKWKTELQL